MLININQFINNKGTDFYATLLFNQRHSKKLDYYKLPRILLFSMFNNRKKQNNNGTGTTKHVYN